MTTSPLNNKPTILLVDDDAALRSLLQQFFAARDMPLLMLPSAHGLGECVASERPSIIVMDLMMPDIDGLTALRALRADGNATPVIMLTARAEAVDRVIGLEMGADDYIGKPFLPQELLARVQALWRRHQHIPDSGKMNTSSYRFGRFELDLAAHALLENGQALRLTNSEYGLLSVLVQHPMETLSRTRLLALWHGAYVDLTERGIDVPIFRLRRLIEDNPATPKIIQTIRGVGYMFVPPTVVAPFKQ